MFDDGCGDGCFKKDAVDILKKLGRARCTYPAQCALEGVGGHTSIAPHGRFAIKLPLHDGTEVEMEGICLDKVTGNFPSYPLDEVEKDLHQAYEAADGDVDDLPRLYSEVGGETDIMIGSKYLKYFPEKTFALDNGFTLYESYFSSPDGSRGVVCGPHRFFSDFNRQSGCHHANPADISDFVRAYNSAYHLQGVTRSGSSNDVSRVSGNTYRVPEKCLGNPDSIENDAGDPVACSDSGESDSPFLCTRGSNCPDYFDINISPSPTKVYSDGFIVSLSLNFWLWFQLVIVGTQWMICDLVPQVLCAGRVAEVSDMVGKCTPITARSEDLRESLPWEPGWVDWVTDSWKWEVNSF